MSSPLNIKCKNCGAPVGYDIIRQTYRCPNCGETSGIEEVTRSAAEWKTLQRANRQRLHLIEESSICPNCGAEVIFGEGEESETCVFCGGSLVRREFEESSDFPEYIIPFVLTREEAKNQLLDWADSHKDAEEARLVRENIEQLEGYYLPYKLIRGPVKGRISRQQTWREYHCKGYMEGTLVNTSRQMDNETLDGIEPFDFSQIKPFEHGYIAGHKVKLSDLSPGKTHRRAIREAEKDFLPEVSKVLQTEGVRVRVKANLFLEVPMMMPVYILKRGYLFAAVNGQTGRISLTMSTEEKPSKKWMREPAFMTAAATLLTALYFKFMLLPVVMLGIFFAVIFFSLYGSRRDEIIYRRIWQGEPVKAQRKGKELSVEEGENAFRNIFPNTPVFYEKDGEQEVPVKVKFYSVGRLCSMALRSLTFLGLPALVAVAYRGLIQNGELAGLPWDNGAAWYVLATAILLMYWVLGVRQDVYNHPILYTINQGKKKKIGSKKSRKTSILSAFYLGGEHKATKADFKGESRWAVMMVLALGLILWGSTYAILM